MTSSFPRTQLNKFIKRSTLENVRFLSKEQRLSQYGINSFEIYIIGMVFQSLKLSIGKIFTILPVIIPQIKHDF